MHRILTIAVVWIVVCQTSCASADEPPSAEAQEQLHDRALAELRRALKDEDGWFKVHAAEALLALGHDDGVREVFEQELRQHGSQPQYRIGIWRVLAQSADDRKQRGEYVAKIVDAYFVPDSPDPLHAVESLAKLGYSIPKEDRDRWATSQTRLEAAGQPFLRWLLAISGGKADLQSLADLLDSPNASVRGRTAYALRHLAEKPPAAVKELPPEMIARIAKAADSEPVSADRVFLISTAYVTAADPESLRHFRPLVLEYLASGTPTEKFQAASALAIRGQPRDEWQAAHLLDDSQTDPRVAAAYAVLRIDRRHALPFFALDWIVIAIYAGALIAIGVYYQFRTRSTEDYLLGGRTMKPWAVGLSYFATLFSTITYLAFPGEMIQHGPMYLCSVLGYPLVFLVGSYLLIPFIMRLKVTSAYEILEVRLGPSVRVLGATFFLAMRLVWMAVIIFATARTVLVPLLRLDDSATPWICFALGAVTIVYTSLGGLQAVIWTDVIQTFILFFAAVLSIVTISVALGGVDAWWPNQWHSDWDPPALWDPSVRVTAGAALLSTFIWYVCTAGSDQMAIQRYLATRDVASARRMFGISLSCNALVTVLLAGLGLALFAYFKATPRMLPDGRTVATGGDRLLPQYIVRGLPAGISGLVVAGLLSAAMSSLSSGLSSCCSVITVDYVDRFRKTKLQDADHMRLARQISWLIGGVVIVLTFFAGIVPGNLLEITNKLVNLLTAPLFVLFFFAMFVPWATALGTWAAAVTSVAVAVAVAFFELWGLSFLWIMPLSLATGVVVGSLASALPIGERRPMIARLEQDSHTVAP